jgi:site-specific DNA recombinase
LQAPRRIEAEYERRLRGQEEDTDSTVAGSLGQRLQHVKRGIARLIDAYEDGLLEKDEFEPRLEQARQRLAQLQAEAEAWAHEEEQRAELRLVIGKLQEFGERVATGLGDAEWSTRRDIIRALVKRIEVCQEEVRIVYRIAQLPFVESPTGGILQDWCRRGHAVDARPVDDRGPQRQIVPSAPHAYELPFAIAEVAGTPRRPRHNAA